MEKVEWTEDISVRNGIIDGQHKQLIAKINDFIQITDKGKEDESKIRKILEFLIEHLNQHIDYEEEYMQKNDFWGLEEHKIEHQKMLKIAINLSEKFDDVGPSHKFAQEIKETLWNCLWNHLVTFDKLYADFINPIKN